MEEETHHNIAESLIYSSSSTLDGPSSSSQVQEEREEEQRQQQDQRQLNVLNRTSLSFSNLGSTDFGHEIWSCLTVLFTFWFFASMTVIFGFYGPLDLHLGPNCSRLVQVNSLFVQSIKSQEIKQSTHGARLYGFYETPSLDVEITWSETHGARVQFGHHKEWEYFLNRGSKLNISYSVKSPISASLSLVISQGRDSLLEWIEDPSHPNTTLSWNIIHGDGTIQQDILSSKSYYIALGSLNTDEVEVRLNFTIKAFVYDTTKAYYNCSLSHGECSLEVFLMMTNAALLTSPAREPGMANNEWYVKLSYGPRWMFFFLGSGYVSVFMILAFKIFSMFQIDRRNRATIQVVETGSEQAPLISQKDDDLSSLGSSYDSISNDEEELDKWLAVVSSDGKQLEGETNSNPQRLCVICFDAPRDCFFLPCGHSATCFTCGTRIIDAASRCPICCRTMKKVRKIIAV